jgi:RNA polymerase sigma factor (sigma-70 family)
LLARFNAHRDESAERAFAALVARHGAMVLRVCCQILGDRDAAEDAFQATFLVLARRCGSIRRPELLGNWLYGVAVRTSCEARMRDHKRREREVSVTSGLDGLPARDGARPERNLIGREEFEALHEELSRLPDRYRGPIVLCELEGLTYQEAARRLRCPVGTVGVRLSRARERLRSRLLRRGIVPAGVLSAAFLGAEEGSACLPAALAGATVRAAAGFAARDVAAAGLVSAPVLALTHAVLKVMALARLKVATGLTLVVLCTATLPWAAVRLSAFSANTSTKITAIAAPTAPLAALPQARATPASEAAVTVFADHRAPAPTPPPVAPRQSVGAPESDRQASAPVVAVARREEPAVLLEAPAPRRRNPTDEQARGALLFAKEWVPDDPMSHGGDGLGPVFNDTSCVACHGLGAPGGAGPGNKNVVILTARTRGGRRSGELRRIHPGLVSTRSTVLHRFGTDPAYDSWRRRLYDPEPPRSAGDDKDAKPESVEARIQRITARTVPASRIRERTAQLHPTTAVTLDVSERNTPALFGAGLIDAIPAAALVEEAGRQPEEVRGRVSRTAKGEIGRFGWKAQTATLHDFVRGACAGELGLEVPGFTQSASPLAPGAKAKGLDMSVEECDALVSYVRSLPAPVVFEPTGARGTDDLESGRELFAELGCATCHTPTLGEVRGLYSDLLLHEMGPSLSDSGISYGFEGPSSPGGPSPGEWRTPPLWGFRDSGPYLHDGRAQTLDEAVALHGGQGTAAARAFFALAEQDRARVETFLKSLVAPSATAVPGVMLASELEERVEPAADREAEALLRKQRAEAAALEAERKREDDRRRQAAALARRAQAQWPLAVVLDRSGKLAGALDYYRSIARDAPGTPEGQRAAARIAELRGQSHAP